MVLEKAKLDEVSLLSGWFARGQQLWLAQYECTFFFVFFCGGSMARFSRRSYARDIHDNSGYRE